MVLEKWVITFLLSCFLNAKILFWLFKCWVFIEHVGNKRQIQFLDSLDNLIWCYKFSENQMDLWNYKIKHRKIDFNLIQKCASNSFYLHSILSACFNVSSALSLRSDFCRPSLLTPDPAGAI